LQENKTRLFSRDYIFIMIAALGTSFVNYFFFSSLSLYAEKLTGTVAFAGYLSLAYSVTALVSRPISGLLSDRHGRVKTIILGTALCVLACVLYGFTTNLILLLLIRVLNGIGMSMNTTSAGAAVPDIVPKERLSEGLGYFGLYTTVAQAIGPFIALAIIKGGELRDYRMLFFTSAVFCGVSCISGCFVKYERGMKRERPANRTPELEQADIPAGKVIFGFELPVLGPALVMMLYFFGISSILSFMTVYGKSREFPVNQLGWFFFVSAGGILLSRLLFGRVVDKRGGDVIVIPGLIATAASLAVVPLVPSLPYLILLALPYGVASGVIGPSINAAMFKRCSPGRRGSVSAAYFAAVDVGITLGAPVMGWIADSAGFFWVYLLSAIVLGLAFLIYVFFVSDKRYR